ncbi:MAG: hypothetical protein ABEJ40_07980 [Haloarculaceae archaeon]
MDSPRDTHRTAVLDGENDREPGDRDLRDVLRGLVVDDGRGDPAMADVAAAAGGSERLLPELLSALADDATAVRIGAAWTLCALADDRPAVVEYLAARLADRTDGEEPFEVGQVLAYLRGRYPGRVAGAVDAAVAHERLGGDEPASAVETEPGDGRDSPGDRRPSPGSEKGNEPRRTGSGTERRGSPARVESGPDEGKRIETDGGVPADAVTDLGDGRQVVRTESAQRPATPSRPGDAAVGPGGPVAPADDPPRDHPTHPDFEPGERDARGDASGRGEPSTRGSSTPPTVDRSRRPAGSEGSAATPAVEDGDEEGPETFAAIGSLSDLDRLSAVDRGVEDRYAAGYRCRAVSDGEERGTAVRLFDRPDEGDRLAFRADLEDCLARWQAVGESDRVVGVAEWGKRPRPWVRTEPVDASLAERGRPPVDEAVDQAVELARAVGELHARGAVHAGIDPENVVYPCSMDAIERPMLDNVGLMGPFRSYFEPANYLDPRFAAPEYFDDEFGTVDAATDVYGLGAVVYFLLAGRPPFDGSYAEVRRGVLDERPPAPSRVNDAVPADLDSVVARALRKRKLNRYDAVETFRRELERVRDGR